MDKIAVGQQDFPVFEFFHEEGMSRQSLKPLCDKYFVGNELGCGSFSVVREVKTFCGDTKLSLE